MESMICFSFLLAICLPIIWANPQSSFQQNCYDGRVCQCKLYVDDSDYDVLKRRIDCLNEVGASHDFQQGSQRQITLALCNAYLRGSLRGADLIKCVFKKVGMIVNIDGFDQWDLENMRAFYIDTYASQFPDPEEIVIRAIIVTTFTICPANPTDFSKIPFQDCWDSARELIVDLLQSTNSDAENLSNDGSKASEQGLSDDDFGWVSLKNYDQENLTKLDPVNEIISKKD